MTNVAGEMREAVVEVRGLSTRFGDHVVHDGLDLDVYRGEVLGVVGGSGTGKSVLLREIAGLMRPSAGTIRVFGTDVLDAPQEARRAVEQRWGVMFQDGALFSSLDVQQNVEAPMREQLPELARATREALAEFQHQPPSRSDPTGVRVMFNNLPAAHNRITIYTASGDLVATIDHDGHHDGGAASWNLISRNRQEVASGIYLYVVESDDARFEPFRGRFVVVR